VLDNWLPFLIYAIFALVIPASMMWFSFVFATRPHRRMRARTIPFESGVSAGAPREAAVHDQLLPHGDALHRLRHRDRVPVSAGGDPHQLAWFGFFEFLFFVVILVIAYVYVWRKGALEWQ
jgi:NADH-quinone oxidoreductase subunit A